MNFNICNELYGAFKKLNNIYLFFVCFFFIYNLYLILQVFITFYKYLCLWKRNENHNTKPDFFYYYFLLLYMPTNAISLNLPNSPKAIDACNLLVNKRSIPVIVNSNHLSIMKNLFFSIYFIFMWRGANSFWTLSLAKVHMSWIKKN